MRAVRADLERVQRLPQVVDRARERRQVIDGVHRLVELQVLGHVVVQEHERVVAQVLEVLQRAGLEVVHADHAVARLKQVLTKMGAEKPGSSGDYSGGHERIMVTTPQAGSGRSYEVLTGSSGAGNRDSLLNLAIVDQPVRFGTSADFLQVHHDERALDPQLVRLGQQYKVELGLPLVGIDDLGDRG